jgi:DNA polymerase zeta
VFADEAALIEGFCAAVRRLDADILVSWDAQRGGLGYLAERGAALGINVLRLASRAPEAASLKEKQDDAWGRDHASGIHVAGRIVLNLWRLMRSELKLTSYTLESVAAAVLRLRVPCVPQRQMAAWFDGGPAGAGARACLFRACCCFLCGGAGKGESPLIATPNLFPPPPTKPKRSAGGRWRCLARVGFAARLNLRLLDTLDFVGRTAELAR